MRVEKTGARAAEIAKLLAEFGIELARMALFAPEEQPRARQLINAKYWLARIPFLWRNTDAYLEITPEVRL